MMRAISAEEFVQILNAAVDDYHRLATWKFSGKLAKAADKLKYRKLNGRVQQMIEQG